MINAWSLLYEELNGTMDKTYPIENNELNGDKIEINTGTGNTIFNVPDSVLDDIAFPSGTADDDVLTIDGGDSLDFGDYPTAFTAFADNDDSIAHHIDLKYEELNLNIGANSPTPEKPQANLDFKTQKYEEDKTIADLKNYVTSTYRGHYTSEQNNTQTLDLIQSVGDAESFCRSNAIKYLARYDKKGSAKNDILKAMHYCLLLYYFSGNTQEPDYTNSRYETF